MNYELIRRIATKVILWFRVRVWVVIIIKEP